MGILGCALCVIGSTIIVLHAPGEPSISSVDEIWALATQPGEVLDFDCFFNCLLVYFYSKHNIFCLDFLDFLVQLFLFIQP